MESAFSEEKECWVCHSTLMVEDHHIYPGVARRHIADDLGLHLYLCNAHHREVHENPNKGLDLELKKMGQKFYESYYGSRSEFRECFGKSYL